jgi:hypothetical protein
MEDFYFLFKERVARFARNWSGREKVEPLGRAYVRMDIATDVRTNFPKFIKETVGIVPETDIGVHIEFKEDTKQEELAIIWVYLKRHYVCMDHQTPEYRQRLFRATRRSKDLILSRICGDGGETGLEIEFKLQSEAHNSASAPLRFTCR